MTFTKGEKVRYRNATDVFHKLNGRVGTVVSGTDHEWQSPQVEWEGIGTKADVAYPNTNNLEKIPPAPVVSPLEEIWQEGNTIEFTAIGNRVYNVGGKLYEFGCKNVDLASGLTNGIIQSVTNKGADVIEAVFRGTIKDGRLAGPTGRDSTNVSVTQYDVMNNGTDYKLIEKAPEETYTVKLTLKELRVTRNRMSAIDPLSVKGSAWRKFDDAIKAVEDK